MSSAKPSAKRRRVRKEAPTTAINVFDPPMVYAVETRINEVRSRIGVLCALFAANDGDVSNARTGELAGQARRHRREDFSERFPFRAP